MSQCPLTEPCLSLSLCLPLCLRARRCLLLDLVAECIYMLIYRSLSSPPPSPSPLAVSTQSKVDRSSALHSLSVYALLLLLLPPLCPQLPSPVRLLRELLTRCMAVTLHHPPCLSLKQSETAEKSAFPKDPKTSQRALHSLAAPALPLAQRLPRVTASALRCPVTCMAQETVRPLLAAQKSQPKNLRLR